ncbi:MAG: LPXTG cell wall anchor domain-containing protein [Eubacterium sp.]|nr:LPXTG cell wall anchor domain-containing protein [Eubacterium sp.]
MPNTGGIGTLSYTLCGLALIMAATMMYCVKMRRKGGDGLS